MKFHRTGGGRFSGGLNGRAPRAPFTFEIASHDNGTTCKRPARAPTPLANTGNLCKRLKRYRPDDRGAPRASILHALHPPPPLASPPAPVLLCIIIVVDAKKFNGRNGGGMVVGYPNDLSFGKDFAAYPSFVGVRDFLILGREINRRNSWDRRDIA